MRLYNVKITIPPFIEEEVEAESPEEAEQTALEGFWLSIADMAEGRLPSVKPKIETNEVKRK